MKVILIAIAIIIMIIPSMMFAQGLHPPDGARAITACDGSWWSYTVWHWTGNVVQASITFYRDGGYLEGEFAFIEWIVVDPIR